MKFNSDFKHDLELGEMAETDFHLMLSEKKIEVKYDRKTKETGNVYIEFESRNKPSGIKTTQADYWTYFIDDDCPVGKQPVNVFKMNAQFYATMEFRDWLNLLAKIQELEESHRGLEEEVEDLTNKLSK